MVFGELFPRGPTWIAGNHWFPSFFNLWHNLIGLGCSLRAVVILLAALLCVLLVVLLASSALPLGRALCTLPLIGTVPARMGSYEGRTNGSTYAG